MRKRTIFFSMLLLVWLLVWGGHQAAAGDDLRTSKVKVAFLVNFAKFITWPQSFWPAGQQHFQIGIFGNDFQAAALNGIEGQRVNGKMISLQPVQMQDDSFRQHQMVYIGKAEQNKMARILSLVAHAPVVTVSDIEGFAESGGIFELRVQDGRVTFIINNSKAREQGLRIRAALLDLATEVL